MDIQKICPVCKTSNPAHEFMCQKCMGDISSVEPIPIDEKPLPGSAYEVNKPPPQAQPSSQPVNEGDPAVTVVQRRTKLRLKLENFDFEIDDGDIVGRSHVGKELLNQFPGISRKHARFSFENGDWYIEDLQSTNGTYVNGVMVPSNSKHAIKMGDRLGISKKVTFEIVDTGSKSH